MAIYTRFGSRVVLLSAELVKVWTTFGNMGNGPELKWHYQEPRRTTKWRKDVKVEAIHAWHFTARYDDDRPGHGGTSPLEGSRSINDLRADGGIKEIHDECCRLNPADAAREREMLAET